MDVLSAQAASSDFLSLLTIQLQNQDPIDPVDQEGLVNDLTQFSILEGIQNLNTSFEQVLKLQEVTRGIDLVGKQIQFISPEDGTTEAGVVDELFTTAEEIRVSVNGQSVNIADVISVSNRTDEAV